MSASKLPANEKLFAVRVHWPNVEPSTIPVEQILAFDMASFACAWKDEDGRIHRVLGVPLESISVEQLIASV